VAFHGNQVVNQIAGGQPVGGTLPEGGIDVGQQLHPDRVILDRCLCCLGRAPRPLRPLAAGGVSDCKQRAPIVGCPVEDAGRHRRVGLAQAVEIVRGPARRLASKLIEMRGPV
jgi:hypothetical protein